MSLSGFTHKERRKENIVCAGESLYLFSCSYDTGSECCTLRHGVSTVMTLLALGCQSTLLLPWIHNLLLLLVTGCDPLGILINFYLCFRQLVQLTSLLSHLRSDSSKQTRLRAAFFNSYIACSHKKRAVIAKKKNGLSLNSSFYLKLFSQLWL